MHKHTYFDLPLHDDIELSMVAGCPVKERVTLHEWPLSSVEKIILADGRTFVYKSQTQPSVEVEFYAAAHSDLLIPCQVIYNDGTCACTLQPFVDAPHPDQLGLNEGQAVSLGHRLTRQIQTIRGDLPCYMDISSPEKWAAVMQTMLEELQKLVEHGVFTRIGADHLEVIRKASWHTEVLQVIPSDCGCVHSDLSKDNVFVRDDRLMVIDWQRPLRGPGLLDLALLLESLGYDPEAHTGRGIVMMLNLLRIEWFTACSVRWFPPGVDFYDQAVAQICSKLAQRL